MSKLINVRGLIYLWTRDAGMAVNQETIDYVSQHLSQISKQDVTFSDKYRIEMVDKILELL